MESLENSYSDIDIKYYINKIKDLFYQDKCLVYFKLLEETGI